MRVGYICPMSTENNPQNNPDPVTPPSPDPVAESIRNALLGIEGTPNPPVTPPPGTEANKGDGQDGKGGDPIIPNGDPSGKEGNGDGGNDSQKAIEEAITARLREMSEGKASTLEEFAELKAKERQSPIPDFMQKMLSKYPDGNVDFDTFNQLYSFSKVDESKLSDDEAIRMKIQMENPGKDTTWIDREMRITISKPIDVKGLEAKLADLEPDDDDYAEVKAQLEDAKDLEAERLHKLEKIATEARSFIKKEREAIQWPDAKSAMESAKTEAEARRGLFSNAVADAQKNIPEIVFKVGGHDVKYRTGSFDDATKFAQSLYDGTWASRYMSEDGKSFDVARLVQDAYVIHNLQNILDSVTKDVSSRAIEAHVRKMENPSGQNNGRPVDNGRELTDHEKWQANIKQQIFGI